MIESWQFLTQQFCTLCKMTIFVAILRFMVTKSENSLHNVIWDLIFHTDALKANLFVYLRALINCSEPSVWVSRVIRYHNEYISFNESVDFPSPLRKRYFLGSNLCVLQFSHSASNYTIKTTSWIPQGYYLRRSLTPGTYPRELQEQNFKYIFESCI